MSLMAQYEAAVTADEVENDPLQRKIITHLQHIADELQHSERSWFKSDKFIEGLYLHGPVGAGKTFLMDLFYKEIKLERKSRFHFHYFMQQVDAQLRRFQGQKDPLRRIAAEIAQKSRLLCLDEFLVYDIADAMILGELFKELFARNIVLVATSNTPPDKLYLKGLQRARFLPAIDLIKKHCDVLTLNVLRDYRLDRSQQQASYLFPLDNAADKAMATQFDAMASPMAEKSEIMVQKRKIACRKVSEQAVWFDFNVICNIPRSQLDYLEIADRYQTVFVSNIPELCSTDTVHTILFMHFIDVMYDNGVRVVISAEVAAEELYKKGDLYQEFQRTVSRLQEMQSESYWYNHG